MPTNTKSPPSEYVTLISNDGFEYVILREAACVAGTIKKMLDPKSNFIEASTGRCVISQYPGIVLEKVCEYLYYNLKYRDIGTTDADANANAEGKASSGGGGGKGEGIPDMDIPPLLCMELLMAADFFDV
ncbi:MAG: hypothetical protein L6R37_003955 [Teloschistes peruensis]|nr:MAG: hypothetical protein L6R37_003955 [Teloschistes peruensis]